MGLRQGCVCVCVYMNSCVYVCVHWMHICVYMDGLYMYTYVFACSMPLGVYVLCLCVCIFVMLISPGTVL